MKLQIGDIHLINEANDRFDIILSNIHNGLKSFGFSDKIDEVYILGDTMDCDYLSYKKIVYFSNFIKYLKDCFSVDHLHILIGNHDKYYKNDTHYDNVLKFIYNNSELISNPTIIDRILYIPHYYENKNFIIESFKESDFDLICGHLAMEFIKSDTELTAEEVKAMFPNKRIITGHIHNIDMRYKDGIYFIGSLKSDTFNEESHIFSVCMVNDDHEIFFLHLPYHKFHLTVEVSKEDELKSKLSEIFNAVNHSNMFFDLYDSLGNLVDSKPTGTYITSVINLKLKIVDPKFKKSDIDLIIDLCRNEIDNPDFLNIKIKPIYRIDSPEDKSISKKEMIRIDEKEILDEKKKFYNFLSQAISSPAISSLLSNKKFSKNIDGITDSQVETFVEYLVFCDGKNTFTKLCELSTQEINSQEDNIEDSKPIDDLDGF